VTARKCLGEELTPYLKTLAKLLLTDKPKFHQESEDQEKIERGL
jgi:hypothetical protein